VDWLSRLAPISGDGRKALVRTACRWRWDLADFAHHVVDAPFFPQPLVDALSPFEMAVIKRVFRLDFEEEQWRLGTFHFLADGSMPYGPYGGHGPEPDLGYAPRQYEAPPPRRAPRNGSRPQAYGEDPREPMPPYHGVHTDAPMRCGGQAPMYHHEAPGSSPAQAPRRGQHHVAWADEAEVEEEDDELYRQAPPPPPAARRPAEGAAQWPRAQAAMRGTGARPGPGPAAARARGGQCAARPRSAESYRMRVPARRPL